MSKKRICLDAGHYSKYNPGVVKGYYESEIVWKLTMLEKELLEAMGIEVVLTRTDIDANPDLFTRGKTAKGCDLFVSNHTNACDDPSVNRVSVIYLVDNEKTTIDDKSKEFATKVAPVVKKTMGVSSSKTYSRLSDVDRDGNGKIDDNYYGVLHGAFTAKVPAVIIEHSFHTNADTCNWLMNDENLKKLAKACVKCMANFVGVTDKPVESEAPKIEIPTTTSKKDMNVGDVVTIKSGATYYSGKDIPTWVEKKQWIVREIKGDRVVIDKSTDGANSINSAVNIKDLTVVKVDAPTKEVKCTGYARSGPDDALAGAYVTTTNLNLRNNAGVANKSLCVIPKGTKVKCYGYYTITGGAKWLCVKTTVNNVTYTGFCNGNYLKKQ
mgnify:CR=1 FL=1